VDDLIGAVWGPQDGMAGPAEVTAGYARRARELGARIEEGVDVTAVVVEHGRVTGVRTAQGDVGTRIVINAAGPTAARVAKRLVRRARSRSDQLSRGASTPASARTPATDGCA